MAEEKTIVLRVETITDKAVMEAYGKTLNDVLGSYEENNTLIAEYTQRIKDNNAAIKSIQKEGEKWGKLTERQSAAIKNMTAENEKLKIAKAELVQITKNQIKVDSSEAGSMENKSQLLGKLRMAWRKMTDEQKNANQGMLQTIQQLDASLKQADGSIGNFQRNVGDYQGAINGLISRVPVLGNVLGAIPKGMGVVGVAVGALAGGFKVLSDAMMTTQTTGDAIKIEVAAWHGVWDRFLRMIATADFSNFIDQLTGAYGAAKDLARARDEMFEIENSIRLLKAEQSIEEQNLLRILRDQTKSNQERIKAGQAYEDLIRKNAQIQADAYNKLAEEELDHIAAQTGANKEALRSYIKDYADPKNVALRKELDAYKEAMKERQKIEMDYTVPDYFGVGSTTNITGEGLKRYNELGNVIDSASEKVKAFYKITEDYNKTADALVAPFVNAWDKALRAQSNAIREGNRAASMVSGLLKKEMPKSIEIDTSKAIDMPVAVHPKIDISSAKAEFTAMLDEVHNEVMNDPALDKVAVSPIARALGVTDEQLKTIEDRALQAAGQIFNSIAQLSKEATQRRLKDELDAIDKQADSEKAALKNKADKGVITQEEYEERLAEIDEKTAERKEQANKEAFEKQKKWNIAQALMNAALAITKTFSEYGGTPMAWIMSAITAATTAAEIAVIASQKYARGGELHGPSHAHGGIKGFVGNQHIEAEGGEVIINKRSSAKHRKLLSLINSDNGWGVDFAHARGGGRFFARGGMIGGYDFRTSGVPDSSGSMSKFVQQQTDNLRASFEAINRRIDNIRVTLSLSDVEAKSNEKRVNVSRATLWGGN